MVFFTLLFSALFTQTDPDVFRRHLIELLPRLRRFARTLTASSSDADDLVQAACERALSRREQFQEGTRMDSWMFRIIHTLRLDEVKSGRNRAVHFSFEEQCDGWNEESDDQQRLEARMMLERVMRAMESLSPTDRAVLGLVCIDDMSYKEAAATLDIPIGTLMSRLARARMRLMALVNNGSGSAA
ncbi:MAG: RNA polymerase sigma factor [Desulfobulbus sp.]|jgi:RNA polymerase sigma-70 factor (ECF subfamily)